MVIIAFENLSKHMKLIHDDGKFETLLHKPSGQHLQQGSLVRGDGLWERKGCAHDQGYRRFTSMKLEKLERKGTPFMISRGVFPPFMETRVFITILAEALLKK